MLMVPPAHSISISSPLLFLACSSVLPISKDSNLLQTILLNPSWSLIQLYPSILTYCSSWGSYWLYQCSSVQTCSTHS